MSDLKQILYVEDDPDIQAIGKMTLEALGGFTLRCADSGQQALDAMAEYTPQLIVLDMMMPGMDGLTTLQKVRELPHGGDIPVIFVTAKVLKHEIEDYRQMGVLGVITKPFDPMTLSSNIEMLWEGRLG